MMDRRGSSGLDHVAAPRARFIAGFHGVRYQVKDVSRSVAFYTHHLGLRLEHQQLPAFASVSIRFADVSKGEGAARLPTIKGMVPSLATLPPGCKFNPRCPDVMPICLGKEPARMIVGRGHDARCYLHGDEADPERL